MLRFGDWSQPIRLRQALGPEPWLSQLSLELHYVGDVTPSQMSTFEPTTRDFASQFIIHSKLLFPKFLLLGFMGLVHESIIRHF